MTTNKVALLESINHRNSFACLQPITAYVLRFNKNIRDKTSRIVSISPGVQELEAATEVIVKEIQLNFKEDLKELKKSGNVSSNSKMASLTPFVDTKGIIRVGGRLEASNLTFDAKHPMLLCDSHKFTKLLLKHLHIQHLHCGPQALLAITRQRFWPLRGKILTRSVVHHCVKCSRANPRPLGQLMGNLPSSRVQPARPFVNAGVDFCGPIWTHFKIRGKRPQKSYVAVFCCFATKGVHLEVVSDLTTNGFLGALKRFIGRRGMCRNLYCDNATNFIGARNQLEELQQIFESQHSKDEITKLCTTRGIDFHFIPPRAPHFGGLWEAAVKSAKLLLQRTVSSASLTYEELETVMVEIEAVLNSRPLTPLSSDPNDLTALTPGHFLIGEPLTSIVDPNASPLKANLLERWKLVSYIKHEFWRRWSREYLSELQHRYKWKLRAQNIKPGTMVVIKEDNLPPLKWQLGRITEAIEGEDGLVRVANVKTAAGLLRRPIHSLCPLPVPEEEGESSNNLEAIPKTTPRPLSQSIPRHPKKGRFLPINKNWLHRPPETTTQNSDNNEVGSTEEPSQKRQKISRISNNALSLLLLTSLIMPSFAVTSEPVQITQFDHQPGLYFENLGITNLIANEWNLIVFYDLQNYWKEFKSFERGVKRLSNLCNQIKNNEYCKAILFQFYQHIDEIKGNNELLLNRNEDTVSRTKRSPLDIIGNIANKLFGVLDQDYAEQASKIIDNLKSNEDYLLQLSKNQTSLIESTANIMKKNQERIERQFEDFENGLNELSNQAHEIGSELHKQKVSQLATTLSIYTSLIMTTYQQTQDALIEVITDTHNGRINPLLLTPKQLKDELINIKNHLPSTLRLPGPNKHTTLQQLYNLMSVQGEVTSEHVIFNIKIPLFTSEEFELFRLIPVPVLVNDTFMAIKPSTNFLLINLHRDKFYQISDIEFSECESIGKNNRLCKQTRPVYNKDATLSQCELSLINNQPVSSKCELIHTTDTQRWVQLYNPNSWIYAVQQETIVNIVCGTRILQKTLQNSGLLKFNDNCLIKDELMTISSHNTYPTQLRTSFIPSTNLTSHPTLNETGRLSQLPQIHRTNLYHAAREDITKLQETIQEMKANQYFPTQLQSYDIHQFIIGYLALAIIAIMAIYTAWRRWTSKPRKTEIISKPTPLPRTISKEEDFTFEIQEVA